MGKTTKKAAEELPLVIQDAGEVMDSIAGMTDDTEAIIHLYRIPEAGRSRYLMKIEKSVFDLDTVREKFGGGRFKYVISVRGINTFQASFEIEGEPILSQVYKTTNPTVVGKSEPSSPYSYPYPPHEEDRLKRLEEKLNAFTRPTPASPLDPLMAKLLESVLAKAMGSSEDLEQKILGRMEVYKNLFGGQDSTKLQADVIQSLITKGMELARDNSGEGGTPWSLILEKMGPVVQELATALVQTTGKPRVVNPATASPEKAHHPSEPQWVRDATGPQATTPPVEPSFLTPGFTHVAPMLKSYIPAMFASASANVDPEKWGDMILEHISEEAEPHVISWLGHESWFHDLTILEPRITGQVSWWEDLRGILLRELTAPPDDGEGSPVMDADKLTQQENL